ncbi:MAG TPA: DUF488 domain-containing protein [Caulobacteraceae bacterium]|nr:DUF488 domain-containing protein [Caulobacteraceae bacterium]
MQLATIGYEGQTQDAMIGKLVGAGVKTVIDVRAIAASRRAGFSKGVLAASLKEAGIGYAHLRALGTPKAGRDAARKGRTAEMREIYEAHLTEPAAQLDLLEAGRIAQAGKSALLCFEADACRCHRAIVADRLRNALGLTIEDL